MMRFLSFGAGTQSTAMLLASDADLIPRADVAIFADTGDEPRWVYENLERVKKVVKNIPIHSVSKGISLSDNIRRAKTQGKRFANIPMFTITGSETGQLRRQCTREFKIDVIEKEFRRLLGYEKGRRIPIGACISMIGISLDEADRMRPSRTRWVTNDYPLTMNLGWRRQQCVDYIKGFGLPEPGKSSCVFCPYHSDAMWSAMKSRHPAEWKQAVEFDELIRDMTKKGLKSPAFLHRSCVPLADVNLNENQRELFGEECTGYCGV